MEHSISCLIYALHINTLKMEINISVPALKTGIKNMIISFWIIIISRWSPQTSLFFTWARCSRKPFHRHVDELIDGR